MIESITVMNLNHFNSILMNRDNADFLLDDEEGIDWGTVDSDLAYYSNLDGVGSTLGRVRTTQPRVVTIVGWIINSEKSIEDKKRILSKTFSPLDGVRIYADNCFLEGICTSAPKFALSSRENNSEMCKFTVRVECVFPFFCKDKTYTFDDLSSPVNVRNDGDFDVGAEINLTIKSGSELSFVSFMGIHNSFFQLKNLPGSGTVTVNTVPGKKTVKLDGITNLSIWDFNSQWVKIYRSISDYESTQVTVSGASVSARISFQELYINLKEL